jgi:predicted nucleic acid-binding protein
MIVLDSNVLSELMRTEPAQAVTAWVQAQQAASLCTTAVSVAEIRYGLQRLPAGKRRTLLREAADDVFESFADQVLPFDAESARHYADIVIERERAGTPISGFDAQIAGICRTHKAALATRNTDDFTGLQLPLIDPWAD